MVVFGFLVAMVITAWAVRGLSLLLGRSKTNPVNRIDEVPRPGTLPLNELPPDEAHRSDLTRSSDASFNPNTVTNSIAPPTPTADASRVRGPGVDLPISPPGSSANLLDGYRNVRPLTKAQKRAAFITAYIDVLTWSILWTVGFVIYMKTDYSMPAQLSLNVLTWFLAMRIRLSVRRFIHPLFPCAACTILGIFILSAIKRESLDDGSIKDTFLMVNRFEAISH